MVFGLFSKKNDILNGIENKDVDEVTSYIEKIKNYRSIKKNTRKPQCM